MSIFETLKDKALTELIRDPRVRDLVTKREFRMSQEELREELENRAAGTGLQDLKIIVADGFLELSGRMRKRLLPFPVPFSARFSLHSLEFSAHNKIVRLKLEELKPLHLDWLTKKLVEKVVFLSFADELVTIHLGKVPRLAALFAYHIKRFQPFDHIVLKELTFGNGEVVGRVGVLL